MALKYWWTSLTFPRNVTICLPRCLRLNTPVLLRNLRSIRHDSWQTFVWGMIQLSPPLLDYMTERSEAGMNPRALGPNRWVYLCDRCKYQFPELPVRPHELLSMTPPFHDCPSNEKSTTPIRVRTEAPATAPSKSCTRNLTD